MKFLGGAMQVLVLMWVRYMFQTAVLAGRRTAGCRSRPGCRRCSWCASLLLLCNSTASSGCRRCRWPNSPPCHCWRRWRRGAGALVSRRVGLALGDGQPRRHRHAGGGAAGRRRGSAGARCCRSPGRCGYAAFASWSRAASRPADDLVVTNFLSALFVAHGDRRGDLVSAAGAWRRACPGRAPGNGCCCCWWAASRPPAACSWPVRCRLRPLSVLMPSASPQSASPPR